MSELQHTEEWRTVEGFPAYQVSNLGQVRSRYRRNGKGSLLKNEWRVLRSVRHAKTGYLVVSLSRGGKQHSRYVHRLVLEAFVGPCPPGLQARHFLNNNRADDRLVNLSWGTRKENQADRIAHGTAKRGSDHWRAELNEATVLTMRRLHAEGVRICDIAKQFSQTWDNTRNVVERKTWKHV